jgi:hypothetical protein
VRKKSRKIVQGTVFSFNLYIILVSVETKENTPLENHRNFLAKFLTETFTDAVVNGRFVNRVPDDIQIYTYFTIGLDPKRLKEGIV